MVKCGGLIIQMSIDLKVQDVVQNVVLNVVGFKDLVFVGIVIVQLGIGLFMVMVQFCFIMGDKFG